MGKNKHHLYYSEDTEQRKNYFDGQFLSYAKKYAQTQGLTLNELIAQIKDFSSFKTIVTAVWSQDSSLLAYFEGMDSNEQIEFYNRDLIQGFVNNKELKEEKIPDLIFQENKKTQKLFLAETKNKKTGKKSRVFAKQVSFIKQGKRVIAYKDSKGHFAKRI